MSSLASILPEPPVGEKPAGETPPSGDSPIIARLVTGVLLVVVPIMIAGICWRWATVHGPTTAVIVRGDASLEGATIIVTGNGKTWPTDLDHENNWQTPILLDPGIYHITVTHHGRTILDTNFPLDNQHGIAYDLPSMIWLIGSPLLTDAEIELSRVSVEKDTFTPMELRLTAANSYRTPKYLPPGVYRCTVRNIVPPHRVISQVEFTVERTGTLPLRVDLGKAAAEGEWGK